MTEPKQILIVDDEPNVARVLTDTFKAILTNYNVEAVGSGLEAIQRIKQSFYSVVLTDYSMPGMSGVELAEEIQQVSPATQVILMTAFGSEKLRHMSDKLNLAGYIDKPFSLMEISDIVQQAIERTSDVQADINTLESPVREILEALRMNTGARCVLLLSSNGYLIDVAGQTQDLDIASLSTLIAANFLAATEVAKMVGNQSVFKTSYHEGPDYNFYSYDVNGDLLLSVIFGAEAKPGVIWLYTKRTATELADLFIDQELGGSQELEALENLDIELDQLFL